MAKKRIQVHLSEDAQKELEELGKRLNLDSISDVIRSSLKLTSYLELEKKAGNEVIIRSSNGKEKEIVFVR